MLGWASTRPSFDLFFASLLTDNSITAQTKLPTSTVSPKSSPETKITEISSSKDDDDLDNDNENISVTGSPDVTCDAETPSSAKTEGAFTSIIQKSQRKSEFTSQFPVNSQFAGGSNPGLINHALAAHLFFQNPLLPQPNQWLYNHLYNNYNDFPWLRHTLANNAVTNGSSDNAARTEALSSSTASGLSFIKRSITLLTNNNSNDKENDSDVQSSSSPPVSSTKRSPSPNLASESAVGSKRRRSTSVESITKENVNEINRKAETFISRTRMGGGVKQNDVWRPY